jgi:hypothetical protein
VVALVAGVLAGGLGQFGDQCVLDALEAGVVIGAERDGEGIGHDAPALDVDRAVVVHLPEQAPTELDGADVALEGAGEHAVDHTL